MIHEDTISLLRECSLETRTAIHSIDEILKTAKNRKLLDILTSSRHQCEKSGSELHILLQKYGSRMKEPASVITGMSWIKTNARLMLDDSDRVCASLLTDDCNRGTKTMQRRLNEYPAADRESKQKAEDLISIEEKLACELRAFL